MATTKQFILDNDAEGLIYDEIKDILYHCLKSTYDENDERMVLIVKMTPSAIIPDKIVSTEFSYIESRNGVITL